MSESLYISRGVSSRKEEVDDAVMNLDKGLFPGAFCKILPDVTGADPQWCTVIHSDGVGTKASLAYVYWRETGDLSVWEGIAQDAVVMNLDDLLCVGVMDNIVVSSIINRNRRFIPGCVVKKIIESTESFIASLRAQGFNIHFGGGETADVGDLVRTLTVDASVTSRLRRSEIIDNSRVEKGDVIVGLASFGRAVYEKEYNSGIGSNGLTSARHDLLNRDMAEKYPESYDSDLNLDLAYIGKYSPAQTPDGLPMSVGKLLLSPTRTYLPFAKELFSKMRDKIHGMIHCTGGGQAKSDRCLKHIRTIKDNPFPLPPIFSLISKETGNSLEEMRKIYNMGHLLEIYTPSKYARQIIEISQSFNIDAQIIGRVE